MCWVLAKHAVLLLVIAVQLLFTDQTLVQDATTPCMCISCNSLSLSLICCVTSCHFILAKVQRNYCQLA